LPAPFMVLQADSEPTANRASNSIEVKRFMGLSCDSVDVDHGASLRPAA
jgi:hypothetical protein